MKNSFVEEFMNDISMILDNENKYMIRYDEKNNEIITNLTGDSICYFNMEDKKDRSEFIHYLFKFLRKHDKEYAILNRQKNLELR